MAEAEHLKATDERAYQHEYLGIPVGTGGNVFDRLELREITDAEVASFDKLYQGVDWGYFPDPFAFARLYYDRARETIYLLDEIYEKVWNEPSFNADNVVAVHIRRIREKIEINPKEPKYLKVVWGIGYKIDKTQ